MLAAITKPSLTPGPPESVGVSSEGIRRAEEYVQRAVEAGVVPLADVALVRRGILAWRASFVNPELAARGYRLDAASLYYLCSFTKVFVATLPIETHAVISASSGVAESTRRGGGCPRL